MEYTRIEQRNGYQIITTVDDKGNYTQYVKWDDGTVYGHYKTTLQKMGWSSVAVFLNSVRGFKKVQEVKR